ncbi:Nucleoporin nup85 [Coemansia sp. Benny D115]|nr:Nucleoporin nup85 [Coemansia sp. Benny D115]
MQTLNQPDRFAISRADETPLRLSPSLFPAGGANKWVQQNHTILFALHPLTNQTAISAGGILPREALTDRRPNQSSLGEQRVMVCRAPGVPDDRQAFANDTHAIFVALQSIAQVEETGLADMIKMSRLYREAMLRQIKVLQEAKTEAVGGETEVFQAMHAVWHLLEAMYLSSVMPGLLSASIVPHYVEWLNANFALPATAKESKAISEASAEQLASDHAGAWVHMKRLALRGHKATLATLLDRMASAPSLEGPAATAAHTLAEQARKMPLVEREESSGAFRLRWRNWNEQTRKAARNIGADQAECGGPVLAMLHVLAQILSGDADTIAAVEGAAWQDVLGAVLLYSEPTAPADRLPALSAAVLEQFEPAGFSELDRTLHALLGHSLPEFLVRTAHIDTWLPAHLSDLMHHIGILGPCSQVYAVEPRAHYLVALGELYAGHEDLWRVGLDYLDMAHSRAARAVLEECVMRVPLDSDRKAEQVLRLCADRGLAHCATRIHRQLGRQKWQRGRLGAAIDHFAHAGDRASIARICDQLWFEYLESGTLSYAPVVDGVMLATRGLQHERLQFLAQYRDFHECYRRGELVEAGRVLLELLVGEIVPAYAIGDLLVDAIPLLEADTLVFSSEDTFELMRCAEAHAQTPIIADVLQKKRSTERNTAHTEAIARGEMSIFSVACSRNLARAFVMA